MTRDFKKPTTLFTSDLHLLHDGIVTLSKRPFVNVNEMDEAIVTNWNAVVRPIDSVWVVGDFGSGKNPQKLTELFNRLNGVEKHLVVGNHDEDNEAVLTLPWKSISHIAHTIVDHTHVVMCHYPMKSWPFRRKNALHLFGHMHGRLKGTSRSLDVGVDVWKFTPITLAMIIKRLKTLPPDPDFASDHHAPPGERQANAD